MATFFRYDGSVRNPAGPAVPGASVAVLTQPASFATQPGSPLATLYAAGSSNAATIIGATWQGGQITFQLSTTPPADIVPGSYIGVSGANPAGFNTTVSAPWLVVSVTGNFVIVIAPTNPGAWVSGGTVATSVEPNPTTSDSNGNYSFYCSPGLVSVQIYGSTITERDLPDQGVGTVAGGSVTSVALTVPSILTVTGSPITSAGTFAISLATQNPNLVLAGPTSGGAGTPTFRALVAADLPGGVGTVTSVGLTVTVPAALLTQGVSGSPVTGSGTVAVTLGLVNQNANFVFAGPTSGGASSPTFRALVVSDIPATGYASFTSTLFVGGQQDAVQNASGSADAIVFPGSVFVTTAGVDAMTLATPASPGDNGKKLYVCDTTGHAHTVITAANKIAPSHSTLTFGGTIGNFVELEAFGGLWYVKAIAGVTPS